MSSDVVEPGLLTAEPDKSWTAPRPARARGLRPVVAVLSPVVLALAALAVHQKMPTLQALPPSWMDELTAWQHPYPVFLAALLAASLLAAAVQSMSRPLQPWVRHYAPLIAGATGVVCLWDLSTAKWALLPQPYFPGPDEVLGALVEHRGLLCESALHSLLLLVTGYGTGVLVGLISGVLIGWFILARYWGMPIVKFLGPLPATALVPLVMMLPVRDYLYLSRAALIAYAVWFPVTMMTSSGIANVRLSYLDVARTLGAGRLYLIFRVAIPSALPNIFFGLFMGLGASFLTLPVAEGIGAKAGLGWYIGWQKGYADYAKVYASLVIMSVFFSTIMTLLFKVRDRLLKWQKGVIKW